MTPRKKPKSRNDQLRERSGRIQKNVLIDARLPELFEERVLSIDPKTDFSAWANATLLRELGEMPDDRPVADVIAELYTRLTRLESSFEKVLATSNELELRLNAFLAGVSEQSPGQNQCAGPRLAGGQTQQERETVD